MIIKLTELRKDDKGKPGEFPIWVNFAHVQTFNKSSKGRDTHLKIMGQAYLFVKESPEEIFEMLYSIRATPILADEMPGMPKEMVDDILSDKVRSLSEVYQMADGEKLPYQR